jgi:protein O-mannosyl-transferase
MTSRRAQILVPLLVILASAAVYLPSLTYGFVSDDSRQISMAAPRFTWSAVPSYFTTDIWSFVEQEKSNYYRPVFLIWLLVNYKAFGDDPLPWHLTTIGVHLVVVLLLYLLVQKLTRDRTAAAIAALLFGLHPAHTEAVSWVSGVTEPLFAALSLGVILCHIRAREATDPGDRIRWRAASVALFALDIFQKETAIVVPVLLFAEWWLSPDLSSKDRRERVRTAFLGLLPYLYTTVVYIGMRVIALGGFTPHRSVWPWRTMLWTLPSVAWFYLRGLLWPTGFGIFYDLNAVTQPRWANFVSPLLPVVLAAASLLWIARSSRVAAFAVTLMVVPLLPVLYVRAFSPTDLVHHRYLYVPSAGLALLAALGFLRLSRWSNAASAATLAIVAALLAWGTVQESRPWKDDLTLGARAIAIAPHGITAPSFYGGALYLAGRFSEALPYLQASIADPRVENKSDLLYAAGLCLMRMEAWSAASADFTRVIELRPDHSQAQLMLGLAEMQMDQLDDAEVHLRTALRLRPRATLQYQGYHYYLGTLLEKKGDLSGALAEYQAEFQENPDMEGLVERIAGLQRKLGALP